MQDSQLSKSPGRAHQSHGRSQPALQEPAAVFGQSPATSTLCQQAKYQIRAKKGFLVAKNTTSGLVLLVYSREFQLGVLLHLPACVVPPNSEIDNQNRLFAKSAITMILSEFETLGVSRGSLVTYIVGGSASSHQPAVSKVSVQRTLWNHGLSLTASDIGGKQMRSIWMDMESGRTIIRSEPMPKEEVQVESPISAAS